MAPAAFWPPSVSSVEVIRYCVTAGMAPDLKERSMEHPSSGLSGLPTQGGASGGRLSPVICGIGVHDRPERAGWLDLASLRVCIDGRRCHSVARMRRVEYEPRGARHCARNFAPHPCIRLALLSGPDHEAIIRFGGEAPRRRAHSTERFDDHVGVQVTTALDFLPAVKSRPSGLKA